jgi:LEA14-like dessication related protein
MRNPRWQNALHNSPYLSIRVQLKIKNKNQTPINIKGVDTTTI